MAITSGTYEIFPAVGKPGSLALDVHAAGTTNGANVNSYGRNGTNAQKYYITQESTNKWSIRNINSGKYIDVAAAIAADRTNVQIYEDNDTRAQRWKITETGRSVTVDGITCPEVTIGSYVTDDGSTYMMDVEGGATSWNVNVYIYHANGTNAQRFYLMSTIAEDPTMPVPYSLGVALDPFGDLQPYILQGEEFYPSWICSPAWITGSENHYEWRHRLRSMRSSNNAWGAWSDFTAWTNATTVEDEYGSRENWLTTAQEVDYSWADYKNAEYEFQVRSASTGGQGEDPLHSLVASRKLNVFRDPKITLNSAGWSPAGLRIGWTSDYAFGTTFINIKRVEFAGVIVFNGNITLSGAGTTGSGLIPAGRLSAWAEDGQALSITYEIGYDQNRNLEITQTLTGTVEYDSGTGTITPTFISRGAQLLAVVQDYGTTEMWLSVDGTLHECYEDKSYPVASGKKAFDIPYPMRKPFTLYTATENTDGTRWATDATSHSGINRFANAWTWDGGSAYLIYSPERPNITTSYEPTFEADILDARPYESVSYAKAVKIRKDVSGDLIPNDTSTVEDFEKLLSAGHAKYRSMNGEIFEVAITGLDINEVDDSFVEVSVSMAIETR